MIQQFLENGDTIVSFEEVADVYVINTCTVTNISDKKSRQMIRRTKQLNPVAIVVACGCYAQVAKEELAKIKEIDLILGINEKKEMIKYIEQFQNKKEENGKRSIVSDVMHHKQYEEFGEVTYTEKTRAVVKVQDGCDRFCSYCIIPYARGKVRSRKPEEVIKEIIAVVQKGIKEVVITGIHIASYGKDLKEEIQLIDLLEKINEVNGLKRIRLGSLEPIMITEEWVKRAVKLDKLCHHFHLSLQSGCNATLERMNRRYTTETFEKVTQILRNAFDDVILTTDIIVGFPGETEEEFQETYQFLKKIKFYKMHIFKYSPRKGTKAAIMENQVDGNKKEERSNMLLELSDKNEKYYQENYIGKTVEVLFEEKEGNYSKGHTANYLMVKVDTKEELEGKIKQVFLEKNMSLELIGKILT